MVMDGTSSCGEMSSSGGAPNMFHLHFAVAAMVVDVLEVPVVWNWSPHSRSVA